MEKKKNIKQSSNINDINSNDPKCRLESIYDDAASVEVDYNIPPHRYFRSGVEMIRMANVYKRESNLELAFRLYVKYLTIFTDKILKHPQYNLVKAKDRSSNMETMREIFPLVEELRGQLLEQYKKEAINQCNLKKQQHKERYDEDLDSQSHHEQIPPVPVASDINQILPNLVSRKDELRDIIMPTKLIREFLNLASINTTNNKETCGILAGKLEQNKLFITYLLIPKQSGSSDSCITHNEEEIFDYQDQHNLITLGWIHTHPTQTAFLSSVDLHTHCAYQLMMAEAIAIVCAPKYGETGYFTLTPNHGLNFVAHCRATGFHPHPNEQSLYMHAPHCKLDPIANIHVIDLRKK